jgi:hypothetical protein
VGRVSTDPIQNSLSELYVPWCTSARLRFLGPRRASSYFQGSKEFGSKYVAYYSGFHL